MKTNIELAHEAGIDFRLDDGSLDRFAELVRADQKEKDAQICEGMRGPIEIFNPKHVHYIKCAAAIRASK